MDKRDVADWSTAGLPARQRRERGQRGRSSAGPRGTGPREQADWNSPAGSSSGWRSARAIIQQPALLLADGNRLAALDSHHQPREVWPSSMKTCMIQGMTVLMGHPRRRRGPPRAGANCPLPRMPVWLIEAAAFAGPAVGGGSLLPPGLPLRLCRAWGPLQAFSASCPSAKSDGRRLPCGEVPGPGFQFGPGFSTGHPNLPFSGLAQLGRAEVAGPVLRTGACPRGQSPCPASTRFPSLTKNSSGKVGR